MLDNGAYMPERAHETDYYNCKCPICGKVFHCKPYHLKKYKTHYCSKDCQIIAKKIYMKGSGNHQFGLKGSRNASWKSDRRISRYGYIQLRVPEHPFAPKDGFVFEHRLVAEKYLLTEENSVVIDGKRYLSPKYDVHHKDFDRTNNDVNNLVVMLKGDHVRLHAKEDYKLRSTDEHGRLLAGSVKDKRTRVHEFAETERGGNGFGSTGR